MFNGYISAVVTPFKDGRLDFESFERYLEWLSGSGITGVVVCGSTGESLSLTYDEKVSLIKFASRLLKGKIQVIGGVISSATKDCLDLIKSTEDDVDGFLCICPFYVHPTQAQMISHFSKLSENTSKPIILYNNPKRVGTGLEKEAFDRLVKLKNVVAIKDCVYDLTRFTLWRQGLDKEFDFLTGNDDSAFGALVMGASGVISVSSNVYPKLCADAYKAFVAGDLKEFLKHREILMTLCKLMFSEPSPAPAKYALSRKGLMREEVREPLGPITPELKKKIDGFLEKASDVRSDCSEGGLRCLNTEK